MARHSGRSQTILTSSFAVLNKGATVKGPTDLNSLGGRVPNKIQARDFGAREMHIPPKAIPRRRAQRDRDSVSVGITRTEGAVVAPKRGPPESSPGILVRALGQGDPGKLNHAGAPVKYFYPLFLNNDLRPLWPGGLQEEQ